MGFHPSCWRKYKGDQPEITGEKGLLSSPCVTPDCTGHITYIAVYDTADKPKVQPPFLFSPLSLFSPFHPSPSLNIHLSLFYSPPFFLSSFLFFLSPPPPPLSSPSPPLSSPSPLPLPSTSPLLPISPPPSSSFSLKLT